MRGVAKTRKGRSPLIFSRNELHEELMGELPKKADEVLGKSCRPVQFSFILHSKNDTIHDAEGPKAGITHLYATR